MKRRFSAAEDAVIREMYGVRPLSETAARLSRTVFSVGMRARRLGIEIAEQTCPQCGKGFRPRFVRTHQFCSRQCCARARYLDNPKAVRVAERNRRWKIPPSMEDLTDKEAGDLWDSYKRGRKTLKEFANTIGRGQKVVAAFFQNKFPEEYEEVMERRRSGNYQKGRHFEYRVRDHFRASGYFVLRSPASKGPMDLIAIRPGEVLLIQCKVNQKYLATKEKAAICGLAKTIGAKALLASRDNRVQGSPITIVDLKYALDTLKD